jgi:hypothetical protein
MHAAREAHGRGTFMRCTSVREAHKRNILMGYMPIRCTPVRCKPVRYTPLKDTPHKMGTPLRGMLLRDAPACKMQAPVGYTRL